MSSSASDAAFEGFRVVRRAPLTILFWSLFYVLCFTAIFAIAGPTFISLTVASEAMRNTQPSPAELQALGLSFGWVFLVTVPIMAVLGAVLSAALSRAVLRPEEKAWGYLRLGRDELRVLATTLIVGLTMLAALAVVYLVVIGVGFLAHMTRQPWLWPIVVLFGLGGVAFMAWLSVRLSLATPIAVAEKRIAPFASFALTRGRFWPLLGMALLAGVMGMLVSLLASIVTMPASLMVGGLERLSAYEGQGVLTIAALGWPILLVWVVTQAINSSFQAAVLYAPFTAAYRELKAASATH